MAIEPMTNHGQCTGWPKKEAINKLSKKSY